MRYNYFIDNFRLMEVKMKQKIALTIIITLISFCFCTVFASGTELAAVKTSSTIRLDAEEKNITAYLVNDNNYFKLRDVAYILNGTDKKFSVNWNEKNNMLLWAVKPKSATVCHNAVQFLLRATYI